MKLIKLSPAYKDYVWGGEYDALTLSSVIAEHPEMLGTKCEGMNTCPIMIKMIDTMENLSPEIYLNDNSADQPDKIKMWYVVEHDENASLYFGLNREMSSEEFEEPLKDGSVINVLNKVAVKTGDAFFIEPGMVHAIGKGIVLAEIQHCSNVTYRLYDSEKLDDNGQPRELHIEKGLSSANLKPSTALEPLNGLFASCGYFSVIKRLFTGSGYGYASGESFHSLLVINGSGTVECGDDQIAFSKGDSLFVVANAGRYRIDGDCEIIVTYAGVANPIYRIGVDIGGTSIKCGVIDPDNLIIARTDFKTETQKSWEDVVVQLSCAICSMLENNSIPSEMCSGIGIGSPGTVDSENGVVLFAYNLNWKNARIAQELGKRLHLKVHISNDANCAALGEVVAGGSKRYKSAVLVTLGTGVGSGIILNGKIFEGALPGGSEFGHVILRAGGERCTCGRNGCFEAYASATALYRDAERAIEVFPNSAMVGKNGDLEKRLIFKLAAEGDIAAAGVVYNYIIALAEGITDIVNIFRPEMIILGGGVAEAEDFPIEPLKEYVKRNAFGGADSMLPEIVKAELGNDAGIVGAANLI